MTSSYKRRHKFWQTSKKLSAGKQGLISAHFSREGRLTQTNLLRGINVCVEHIFVVSRFLIMLMSTISHSQCVSLTLKMFFDQLHMITSMMCSSTLTCPLRSWPLEPVFIPNRPYINPKPGRQILFISKGSVSWGCSLPSVVSNCL